MSHPVAEPKRCGLVRDEADDRGGDSIGDLADQEDHAGGVIVQIKNLEMNRTIYDI